jgi:hypothetical protein
MTFDIQTFQVPFPLGPRCSNNKCTRLVSKQLYYQGTLFLTKNCYNDAIFTMLHLLAFALDVC